MIKISISKLPQIDKLIGSELFLVTDKHGPDADSKAASAETIATFAIQQLQGIKGQPNGLAPLDANALVPEKHLPSTAFGVIQFGGMVNGVTVQNSTSDKGYKMGGAVVVYNTDTNRFILKVPDGGTDTFYRDWSNSELHGRPDSDGSVIPRTDKIFIHPQGGGLAYIMTAEKLERFALQSAITSLQTLIAQLQNTKADLDGSVHVKLAQIPDDALDVIEFRGFADVDADSIEVSPAWNADLTNAYVVYNRTNNRFLLSLGSHYYSRWPDSDRFGISHWKVGVTPYPHKTYFHEEEVIDNEDSSHFERAYYRFNGHKLSSNYPHNPEILPYSYGVNSTDAGFEVVKLKDARDDNGKPIASAISPDCDIVYVANLNRLMLHTPGVEGKRLLYPVWVEYGDYGTLDDINTAGIIPHGFKLFKCTADGSLKQWNGQKLAAPLSSYDVQAALSEVTSTYATTINSLRATVDTLTEKVNALETRFAGGVLLL